MVDVDSSQDKLGINSIDDLVIEKVFQENFVNRVKIVNTDNSKALANILVRNLKDGKAFEKSIENFPEVHNLFNTLSVVAKAVSVNKDVFKNVEKQTGEV